MNNKDNNKIVLKIQELQDRKFYGTIEIRFNAGEIRHIQLKESILPELWMQKEKLQEAFRGRK